MEDGARIRAVFDVKQLVRTHAIAELKLPMFGTCRPP